MQLTSNFITYLSYGSFSSFNSYLFSLIPMQQEEGFCSESQLELIEVEYTPTATIRQYKPKQYTNNLKLQNIPTNDKAIFINEVLSNAHKSRFRHKYGSSLVYEVGEAVRAPNFGIVFESNYQHANLQYVISEDLKHYELYIRPDSNTQSHYQWFCFKARNKMIKKATFTIKNFIKPNMLYQKGLRPYFRFIKSDNKQYQQLTSPVQFYKSEEQDSEYYELTFNFEFQTLNQEVEICSQPPYSHARLKEIYSHSPFSKITISTTILGHSIHAFLLNQQRNYKAVVVVFARQHPGETVGSWMMEGFANRLVEMTTDEILWILVPMINVDGVVMGNNRTGMLGYDFNRHWYVDKDMARFHLFPQIVGIIRYFKKRQKDFSKKLKIFIDMHGHSSLPDVFSYGPPHHKDSEYYELSRLLPFLIHQRNPAFSLTHSHYELSAAKRYCARSIFFQRLGFPYSYTVQSSFGIYNNRNINEIDMLKMGESVCEATNQFAKMIICPESKNKIKEKIAEMTKMKDEKEDEKGEYYDDSGSDEDDCTQPARVQFQEKVVNFLAVKNKGKDPKSCFPNQSTQLISPIVQKHQIPYKNTRRLRQRYKTDLSLQAHKPGSRESSFSLPKIKTKSQSRHNKPSSVLDISFNNLSLSQIKQKLYCIRHSKLGKKLLIGTRF